MNKRKINFRKKIIKDKKIKNKINLINLKLIKNK